MTIIYFSLNFNQQGNIDFSRLLLCSITRSRNINYAISFVVNLMLPFWFQTSCTVINRPSIPSVKISIQIMLQELLLIILFLTVEQTQNISLSNQTLIDQRTDSQYQDLLIKNRGIQEAWVKQGEDWDSLCGSHILSHGIRNAFPRQK